MTLSTVDGLAVDGLAPVKGSVAWRYFGDARNLLLGPAVLVLQVAHPVVGAGVLEHSNYREQPWRRLARTYVSLSTIVYGGQRSATAEAARLRERHKAIRGVDAAGRRYSALSPEAYQWVHATLVRGAFDALAMFGRPLPGDAIDEYYQGTRAVGLLLGLRGQHLPADWPAFLAYYDTQLRQRLEDNQAVRDVIDSMTHPAKPVHWLPDSWWHPVGEAAGRLLRLLTIGGLPPAVRDLVSLQWTVEDERRLRRFARVVGWALRPVPPPLLIAGGRLAARRRTSGAR